MASHKNTDEFKILITSDCHLGHNEKHPIRGEDSFRTFEEVLQAAVNMDVDFILLAGDLFDVNKPSIQTMRRTMSLIRKYCFGGNGCQKFLVKNFKNANCIDPNLKVKYPIFTIHGNHDDPVGMNCSCCLDLFSASGLVNYFGKQDNVEELLIKPIIFEKGQTKIIVYGFGSMREERLHTLIQNERFNYLTPDFDCDSQEELKKYLKILLVHQNRVPRPGTKHLNPYDLTSLPDFVIWGHEHRPYKEPEYFEQNNFFILQPGSTVATSLCEAEYGDKYYYLMKCYYDDERQKPRFKIESFRCETVRPFVMSTIDVDSLLSKNDSFKSLHQQQQFLFSFCKDKVQTMLSEARCQSTMINDDGEAKPLIRLRIEYSDKDLLFDRRKLEFHVNKLVANNNDVVRFIRKRSNQMDSDSNSAGLDDGDDDVNGFVDIIRAADISKKYHLPTILIKHFDEANDRKRLTMLDEKFFIEKVDTLTKKNQTDSFKDFTENSKQAIRFVTDMALGDNENFKLDDLKEEIRSIKQKIFNDQEYRSRFQWITREPFVKRPFSLLQQKLSNLTVTGNQSSNIGNTGSKIDDDPFYEDDIDMFDVNDKQEKMSKTSDEKK
nr:double-strand break repair protein MRE11-like [Dermatophagoides farinae]